MVRPLLVLGLLLLLIVTALVLALLQVLLLLLLLMMLLLLLLLLLDMLLLVVVLLLLLHGRWRRGRAEEVSILALLLVGLRSAGFHLLFRPLQAHGNFADVHLLHRSLR